MESLKFQAAPEEEVSPLLGSWRRFGFPGQPPKVNSVAEKRLLEKCQSYTNLVLAGKIRSVGSEDERRKLHNEIAVMIFGKTRGEMAYDLAEKIANFASMVTTGETLDQALQSFEDARQRRLVEGE